MFKSSKSGGFTLVELMVAVVVMGLLLAIAIPNFISRMDRVRESGTKSNMNTLQLMAEDYAVQNGGFYSGALDLHHIADALPPGYRNPYNGTQGAGFAWEDRATMMEPPTLYPGIASYADSDSVIYNIKGSGRFGPVTLVLSSGR